MEFGIPVRRSEKQSPLPLGDARRRVNRCSRTVHYDDGTVGMHCLGRTVDKGVVEVVHPLLGDPRINGSSP